MRNQIRKMGTGINFAATLPRRTTTGEGKIGCLPHFSIRTKRNRSLEKAQMHTHLKSFAVAFVSILAFAAISHAQGRGGAPLANNPAPTTLVTGDAANGKDLYFAHGCYACHGFGGETGARRFVGVWGHLGSEQEFLTFLRARANVAPENKSTSMPNFPANALPDKSAKDIYAYIRSFKSTAPELKDIPALNAILEGASKPAK
jgi:mono/diheme cytochrome c family protein